MATNMLQGVGSRQMSQSKNLIQRHPLVAFFTLAYAIIFVAYFTYIAFPALTFGPFWLVGVFSPTISALIIAGMVGGIPEIKRLVSGLTRWKVSWKWYLAAALLMLIPLGIGLVYIALGNPPVGLEPGTTVVGLLGALLYTFVSGPLSEELGWRGFALPRMQEKHSALTASIVLGVLWTFWHIPVYFLPNATMMPLAAFLPVTIGLAILFTWLYNNTKGSLVIVILAHFCFDFSGAFLAGHLGLLPPMVLYAGGGGGIALLVIGIVIAAGAKNLSRKPEAELPFQRVQTAKG